MGYASFMVQKAEEYALLLSRMRGICQEEGAPLMKQIADAMGVKYPALDHYLKGRRPLSVQSLFDFAAVTGRRLVIEFVPEDELPGEAETMVATVREMKLPVRHQFMQMVGLWAQLSEEQRAAIVTLAQPMVSLRRG